MLGQLKKVTEKDQCAKYLDWWIDNSHRNRSAGDVLIDGNKPPEYVERNWINIRAGLS